MCNYSLNPHGPPPHPTPHIYPPNPQPHSTKPTHSDVSVLVSHFKILDWNCYHATPYTGFIFPTSIIQRVVSQNCSHHENIKIIMVANYNNIHTICWWVRGNWSICNSHLLKKNRIQRPTFGLAFMKLWWCDNARLNDEALVNSCGACMGKSKQVPSRFITLSWA